MSILLLAAALASAGLTWVARRYALRRQLLDEPGERRSHSVATPRGGGVGPVLAFAAWLLSAGIAGHLAGADWRPLLGALLAVAGIGAWDDHRPLGATVRLVVHVAAGIAVAAAFGLWTSQPPAAAVVAVGTVVLVNVWNFMDGIDGIASSQAIVVALAAGFAIPSEWAGLAFGLAACVLGFLPFNFPRARIFLGDVGSGALGVAIATLATATYAQASRPVDSATLLLPAGAFLVDATLTLGRRALRGERWWTPHTQHLYQHLARIHGHVSVTLAYAAWSLAGAALGAAIAGEAAGVILACVAVWYIACAAAWVFMQRGTAGRSAVA